MTADNQRSNIRSAAQAIATVAAGNQLVIAHGNGPQVGLLALQAAAYHDVAPYPLDEIGPIRTLVDDETVVICAGGGGIPTMYDLNGTLRGVEAVID